MSKKIHRYIAIIDRNEYVRKFREHDLDVILEGLHDADARNV